MGARFFTTAPLGYATDYRSIRSRCHSQILVYDVYCVIIISTCRNCCIEFVCKKFLLIINSIIFRWLSLELKVLNPIAAAGKHKK